MILAERIAPLLAGTDWGIGGSLLLWKLGLEAAPNDLDIMTTAANFNAVSQHLRKVFGTGVRTPHPAFRSAHFARFSTDLGVSIDLFAGVRVKRGDQSLSWEFDPQSVAEWRGLPWMRPADWLELYELFDRPARVSALREYLAADST
jgi:hypothetical protein